MKEGERDEGTRGRGQGIYSHYMISMSVWGGRDKDKGWEDEGKERKEGKERQIQIDEEKEEIKNHEKTERERKKVRHKVRKTKWNE